MLALLYTFISHCQPYQEAHLASEVWVLAWSDCIVTQVDSVTYSDSAWVTDFTIHLEAYQNPNNWRHTGTFSTGGYIVLLCVTRFEITKRSTFKHHKCHQVT